MLTIDSARSGAENFLFSPTILQTRCVYFSNALNSSYKFSLGLLAGNFFGVKCVLPELERFTFSFFNPTFSPLFALGVSHATAGVAYNFFSGPFVIGAATGLYLSTIFPFILKPVFSGPSITAKLFSRILSLLQTLYAKKTAPSQEKKPSAPPPPRSKTLQEAILIWIGKENFIKGEDLSERHALTQANVAASFLAFSLTKEVLARSNHPIMANAVGVITLATLSALALPIISSLNDYLFPKDKSLSSENALFCQKALAFVFATYSAPKLLADSPPLLVSAAQSAYFLFFSTFLRRIL